MGIEIHDFIRCPGANHPDREASFQCQYSFDAASFTAFKGEHPLPEKCPAFGKAAKRECKIHIQWRKHGIRLDDGLPGGLFAFLLRNFRRRKNTHGIEQGITDNFSAPGREKCQLFAEGLKRRGGQILPQRFRQDCLHGGRMQIPGPAQFCDCIPDRLGGLLQQLQNNAAGILACVRIPIQQQIQLSDQRVMVIIGSPGKGPAFFRKQIQNIIFGREWNGLQKGIGVFPGERYFFVAKHNIIRNLALGGREPGMIQ